MDSGTLVIGAIMIAICILPFILINNSIKKQKKQLLQALLALSDQKNCKMTQYELGSNLAIGIDENADLLFFFKRLKDKEISQHVNLKDKLELCISPKTKSRPDIFLEFYNSEENLQLNGELQLIEKWAKIINDQIKK